MAKTKWKAFHWLMTVLVSVALLNWGLVDWFDFNLVEWMTFGIGWLATIIYSVVAVVGLIWLLGIVMKLFK